MMKGNCRVVLTCPNCEGGGCPRCGGSGEIGYVGTMADVLAWVCRELDLWIVDTIDVVEWMDRAMEADPDPDY